MQSGDNTKKDQLSQRIKESLKRAEDYTNRLRRTYTRLIIGGLIGSAATVFVAGGTAIQGPVISPGDEGWRIACIIAAVLSLVSAVSVGMVQQLKMGERVPKGQMCIGQLRALDTALVLENREVAQLAREYEEVLKQFPEVV